MKLPAIFFSFQLGYLPFDEIC